MEIASHAYSTTPVDPPDSNLSLGTALNKSGGTPHFIVTKLAGFTNDEKDYVSTVTLTTFVTVREKGTANTFEHGGFSVAIKVTLAENGCGQVTFVKTSHTLGPYFII